MEGVFYIVVFFFKRFLCKKMRHVDIKGNKIQLN